MSPAGFGSDVFLERFHIRGKATSPCRRAACLIFLRLAGDKMKTALFLLVLITLGGCESRPDCVVTPSDTVECN